MAPLTLRPSGRVELRFAAAAVAGSVVLTLVSVRLANVLNATGVFFGIAEFVAAVSALVFAALLASLARAEGDDRIRWVAWASALAAVACLFRTMGMHIYAPSGGPLRTSPDGMVMLSLLWRAALPAFALAALAGARARKGRIAAAFVAGAAIAWSAFGRVPDLDLVDDMNALTPLARVVSAGIAILTAIAAVAWGRAVGRRPTASQLWIAVNLAVGSVGAISWAFVDHRYTASWWGVIVLEAAQLAVPAFGLMISYVVFHNALVAYFERRERDLTEELDQAAELRRLHRVADEERRRLAERIDVVISERRLVTAFQPFVDLDRDSVVGYEALTRFDVSPHRPPNVWFMEADACGRGLELELAAIAQALRALPDIPTGQHLSLNAAPRTILSEGFQRMLDGVPVHRLVVEITEHDVIDDYSEVHQALEAVRARGLRVAIDDLGAGFASMRHILELRPDIIKLDTSLVIGVEVDPVQRALARALAEFAREMGAGVVAEGIETAAQLRVIRELGVGIGQGYFLGRPAPLSTDGAGTVSLRETAT